MSLDDDDDVVDELSTLLNAEVDDSSSFEPAIETKSHQTSSIYHFTWVNCNIKTTHADAETSLPVEINSPAQLACSVDFTICIYKQFCH